jgi:phospholipid/cholesterol/gamma-HCH transport system ATP-binding protein
MSLTPASSAPVTVAIEVTGLCCGYEGRTVLKDVSFTVQRGEVLFVIGGSGCGKSTLLRHLVGLNAPMAGEVKFFGQSFTAADLATRRSLLKTFGVLYQGGALWSSLTLRQNVALPLEEHTPLSGREIAELTSLKLAQVGLTGFEDYYPSEISGGMKKRAGLARALALDPAIVFLDEPSAGLDPITSRKLDDLVLQLRDTFGTTLRRGVARAGLDLWHRRPGDHARPRGAGPHRRGAARAPCRALARSARDRVPPAARPPPVPRRPVKKPVQAPPMPLSVSSP